MVPEIGDSVSKSRIEALTDGVFAIVMTLLVLDIVVPHRIRKHLVADYALLISKGLIAEVIAIHVVLTEDALIATNSLIEDLETITTEDAVVQKVKNDAEKWFDAIKQKSSANGLRLRTGLVISPIDIEDAIVNYADLIVISGGKTGLKERLLGSTTSHVATHFS